MRVLIKIAVVSMMLVALSIHSLASTSYDSVKNRLDVNNISSYFHFSGIFDHNPQSIPGPGFEWPKGSGKYLVLSAGLTLAAFVNNEYRMASGSYKGEYAPGYIDNSNGQINVITDSRFRFYKITRGDNINNNPDWIAWSDMVRFGAPFVDVNHDGIYEPTIDTPGVPGAAQTIFICMTDGFPGEHKIGEGFGGGTAPMFAEVHMTAWAYNDFVVLNDAQFIKWDIINKNVVPWNRAHFGIFCDPYIGCQQNECFACDTIKKAAYCYLDINDGCYGSNPPAFGISWLDCILGVVQLNSAVPILAPSQPGSCGYPEAYQILRGFKNDGSWWLNPKVTQGSRKTKFVLSGDPESGIGWGYMNGIYNNCGGDTLGSIVPITSGDSRFVIAAGGDNYTLYPNQKRTITIAQYAARGSSNLNSITKVKQLASFINNLCSLGFFNTFVDTITNTAVPGSFVLYQNYPNPFNPLTKIKFDIPSTRRAMGMITKLAIYDAIGKEIAVLVNENLKPGAYEVAWNGTNYPSGVYFYKLVTGSYSESRKMVLIK